MSLICNLDANLFNYNVKYHHEKTRQGWFFSLAKRTKNENPNYNKEDANIYEIGTLEISCVIQISVVLLT